MADLLTIRTMFSSRLLAVALVQRAKYLKLPSHSLDLVAQKKKRTT